MFAKTQINGIHPMLEQFSKLIDTEFSFLKGKKIYLAISGGKDSMVLSHLLLSLKQPHILLHCNFQLRGIESDEDETFLRNYAQKNELEIFVQNFDTERESQKLSKGIQETARILRYNWFKSFIENDPDAYLLTAHHLDDSIETFFLNMMRGTGLTGLSGIPKLAGKIIRPLYNFTIEDIFHYIDDFNIDYRKDMSNLDNKYLRNRVRNVILPQIMDAEPHIKTKMKSLMWELEQIDNWMIQEADKFRSQYFVKEPGHIKVLIENISTIKPILLLKLISEFGVHRSNLNNFLNFLTSGQTGNRFYSRSHEFVLDREWVSIKSSQEKENSFSDIIISKLPMTVATPHGYISFSKSNNLKIQPNNEIQKLDLNKISFPLTLRKWSNGDRFKPLGLNGTKLISDVLTDRKISAIEKSNVLVLVDAQQNILTIVGIEICENYKINSESSAALIIKQEF